MVKKVFWIAKFLIVNFTYISCEINPQIEFFAFYISFFVNFTQMDNFHVLDVKPNGGELYIFYQFVCSLFAIICSTFLIAYQLEFSLNTSSNIPDIITFLIFQMKKLVFKYSYLIFEKRCQRVQPNYVVKIDKISPV